MRPRAEWTDRTKFAEVAEALGVSTEYILAVSDNGIVLWTPSQTPEGDIWRGRLERDADGVLHVIHKEFSSTVADMQEMIRKTLEEKLGPPR